MHGMVFDTNSYQNVGLNMTLRTLVIQSNLDIKTFRISRMDPKFPKTFERLGLACKSADSRDANTQNTDLV